MENIAQIIEELRNKITALETSSSEKFVQQFSYPVDEATQQIIRDIIGTQSSTSSGSGTIPVGGVIWAGTSSTPSGGWLPCDGSAVSRATYTNLFSAIGTTYGTGDGSTTFNVPDLRGRVAVMKDTGTFNVLGSTTGSETHTLTEAQLPQHRHALYVGNTGGAGQPSVAGSGGNNPNPSTTDFTDYVGSGQAHNNIQPSLVFNAYIKY